MPNFSNTIKINLLLLAFFFISVSDSDAQLSYKVLFLGNSYTGVNNLPQLVYDVALSAGDTLVFDSNTPGGYQLVGHFNDATSQNKIMAGGWDYVVIQGQSQEAIVANGQFTSGAIALNNMIKEYNPCAVTMPYMTWGRKNGDATNCGNFPVMCTYQGMDTTIRNEYMQITEYINGEVAPVSIVWNYLRQNYPNIELYQPDESHPSLSGSYAAACCFYSTIFKKDPTLITFDSGLSALDAAAIRSAVKTQVFDSLHLYDFKRMPISDFAYQIGPGINEVIFSSMNMGVQQEYLWDFGTGASDSIPTPTYSYPGNGTYIVSLTASNCDLQGLHTSFTDTVISFCSHTPTIFITHPSLCIVDTLWTQPADSYQWYFNGDAIPETNQYLANYSNYSISGFSVMATTNGCSEMSQLYGQTPQWSGYYFDGIGDPCSGDTVAFAVLHINGFLSGAENILWFKNDTLLPSMTNEDTLLITSSGKFECKVIDPNSNCPLDTTNAILEYDCGSTGVEESVQFSEWSLFPNPASETITVKFSNFPEHERIQIYNSMGILTRTISVSSAFMKINIVDLPRGVYYLRLKNSNHKALKFLKI